MDSAVVGYGSPKAEKQGQAGAGPVTVTTDEAIGSGSAALAATAKRGERGARVWGLFLLFTSLQSVVCF